ncbi:MULTISPECIES: glyoxylate/hydroxypyruvate reductase A [unclassified Mesorhizobium]|uniref:2-hydroxyacid dehydrogenase n=1 Tax=unclassified Mesorhizobium TaxID=325217 RepID=UPI00112768A6|nr:MULTISPECIES: glyoxylate/hydroxypyruvate reductase A [unclassified Mesorhizobium]TPJ49401.1 glyoxylate/hydroxypyruvate reductase A [Mesorhizobium sp. B2-6-6]MBZ9701089.1 glyoxylate/hydroxypyruvate reductase A [Mesorhizobium sp. CO1-1-3]MBZ9855045.1 glyoxylate/hydroxypyruvate reductase A [Mesorhizobium sp. CA13]MBZ9895843.1 glyoxylate/hydroxypyruvate reductase A [Mesorhizobium sp. BR1-1-6]MBZ9919127.1 glyoxylate/hydroxypyruvate reductase A [Mesorhizobium sp. BR1-1-7]
MEKGKILLAVTGFHPQRWRELLSAEREVVLEPDGASDPSITYAVVWKQRPNLLGSLPNLRAIFSIGAGVDHIFSDPSLPDVPIVKVVAGNLAQHMTEYVVWRVLDHHRQGLLYRSQQPKKIWREPAQRTAEDISVGIMGLGSLGRAAASALLSLGFAVNGWSRTDRPMEGVATYCGEAGLIPFLNATDILVVLLPLTPDTKGIINYGVLKELRKRNGLGGSVLINAGRGRLQKDADIVRALDDGTLKEASLDVFEVEPLPKTSPLWAHPKVFVTPHAAATSDPVHLAPIMLRQMDAFERGEKLENLVDRKAGY